MKASADETASALTVSFSTSEKFIKHTGVSDLIGTELAQYIENYELYEIHSDYINELIHIVCQQKNKL